MNAAFKPARTPSDRLSRDPAMVDAFLKDPLCFGWLQPAATETFLGCRARLADPGQPGQIRHHLPVYVFSGTEDPVGQQLAGVSVLIGRYRAAGVSNISHDFYPGGRHEMLNESTARKSVQFAAVDLSGCSPVRSLSPKIEPLAVGQGVDVLHEAAVVGKLRRHTSPFACE
jgi:alpha-beta hydrolase superfamily lysophospholipase